MFGFWDNVYYYGIVRVGDGEIVVCYFVDD